MALQGTQQAPRQGAQPNPAQDDDEVDARLNPAAATTEGAEVESTGTVS